MHIVYGRGVYESLPHTPWYKQKRPAADDATPKKIWSTYTEMICHLSKSRHRIIRHADVPTWHLCKLRNMCYCHIRAYPHSLSHIIAGATHVLQSSSPVPLPVARCIGRSASKQQSEGLTVSAPYNSLVEYAPRAYRASKAGAPAFGESWTCIAANEPQHNSGNIPEGSLITICTGREATLAASNCECAL